ncbi:glutathione S-transferase family protein [Maricaulis sp.]|uniref:glutathione S-transferase family protein n=1 Tax=Maricaulis sp. TaxID=1486257 RepID=UPI00329A760A
MMKLYARAGWGSVIAEAQLAWYGLAHTLEPVGDLFADDSARDALEGINPLAQIPILVLDDGTVMTESAAITLHLADLAADTSLVPGPDAHERADFLNALVFLVANVYPTYTYGDVPARFVPAPEGQAGFRETVDAYGKRLYRILEQQASSSRAAGPWFLGGRLTAVDIYLGAMTFWRPGRDWFNAETPRLAAIGRAVRAHDRFGDVWTRNFPDEMAG